MTIAVTEGLTHFSDGSLKLAIIFSETNTNILLRLINQHHEHTKEKVVNKLLHKWKTSGRFSNIMRKSEQSPKTSWYNFVNKVQRRGEKQLLTKVL